MKLPIAIAIIGWFFILAGAVGFVYHLSELEPSNPFGNDALWILTERILAILGGVLVLRGSNFGKWLLILWMAYHVVLSYFHTVPQLVMHTILLAVIMFVLLHKRFAEFFAKRKNS